MKPGGVTALVLAGGGSLGALQVGMLKALAESRIVPDMIVGSSVGSINSAYFAAHPDVVGVAALEQLWVTTKRRDVFPLTVKGLFRIVAKGDFLSDPEGLRGLIERNLPFRLLEQSTIPLHIVSTNFLTGQPVILSEGPAAEAIVASCAIPAAFPAVRIGNRYLVDGGIASNTPIKAAVTRGATRLIVLPTGHACALGEPPRGAIASALHALTLLVSRQIVTDLEALAGSIAFHVVPSLCPVEASPYDFSQTRQLIDRAYVQTCRWLEAGGLERSEVPHQLELHAH